MAERLPRRRNTAVEQPVLHAKPDACHRAFLRLHF